jgi:hypothetical protein
VQRRDAEPLTRAVPPQAGNRLTVAVCTYNRAHLLPSLLHDLQREVATLPAGAVEVVFVDNASTDGTAATLVPWMPKVAGRLVREDRPGISFARNRALDEARNDVVVYFDDDVMLDSGILRVYHDAFADPDVIGAGGPIRAVWPERVPHWVGERTAPTFPGITVHYDLGSGPRPLGLTDPLPLGGNFAFRIEAARAVGGFRNDLGHAGGKPRVAGGEDMEFDLRVIRRFGALKYLGTAGVRHPVQADHLRLWRALRYVYGSAFAEASYSPPEPGTRRIGRVPLWVLRNVAGGTAETAAGALRLDSRRMAGGAGKIAGGLGYGFGLFAAP